MVITDIKIRKCFEEGPMKAVVSVTFDGALAVHDIKVINARDIVHPINADFRAELEGAVIKAYFDELENGTSVAFNESESFKTLEV